MFLSKFINIIFVTLLASVAAFAQSSSDFQSKYGSPYEAYEVRPNVLMTVEYGANGQVSEVVIEARHTSKDSFNGNKLVNLFIAEEILKEVVPIEKRGKGARSITFSAGCTSIRSEEYENVSINITEQCLQWDGKAVQAIKIKWKNR